MNEEKIGKYVKTMYIITYGIFFSVGLIFTVIGVISLIGALAALDGKAVNYTILLGVLLIVLGLIMVIGGIFWLIYFIKLPESPIILKDGKLTFIKAGVQCSPTEVENFNTKSHGLDGAIFGFGKILLTVRGQRIKIGFVNNPQAVIKRLYELKLEYSVKESIASKKTQNPEESVANTVSAPEVSEQTEVQETNKTEE